MKARKSIGPTNLRVGWGEIDSSQTVSLTEEGRGLVRKSNQASLIAR